MPDFDISVSFEVFCGKCGEGLCNQSTTSQSKHRHMMAVNVEPCQRCIQSAEDVARDKGDSEGYERGLEEGKSLAEAAA